MYFVRSQHSRSDVKRLAASLPPLPAPGRRPVLVMLIGLPGTGKSYFSARLAERGPFLILESDALRKVLFRFPRYSAAESYHLFQAIHGLVEDLLGQGISLILDATNLSEAYRESVYAIADRLGIKLRLVHITAPPEVVRERLETRKSGPVSHSDADWAVYEKMRVTADKIKREHYEVDTSQDIGPVLEKIIAEVLRD